MISCCIIGGKGVESRVNRDGGPTQKCPLRHVASCTVIFDHCVCAPESRDASSQSSQAVCHAFELCPVTAVVLLLSAHTQIWSWRLYASLLREFEI